MSALLPIGSAAFPWTNQACDRSFDALTNIQNP
jgi:hypothetical protein